MNFTTPRTLKSGKKAILLLAFAAAIILFVRALLPTQAQQPPREPEFDFSQPDGLEKAREQYKETINCYFNTAAQSWINTYNQRYQELTGLTVPPTETIEESDLGCDQLSPLGETLHKKLKMLLEAVDRNLENTTQRTQAADANKQDTGKRVCNFMLEDLQNNASPLKQPLELDPAPKEDYFTTLEKEVVSPVYAIAIVSQCYEAVYESYLTQYYSDAYDAQKIAQQSEKSTIHSDEIFSEISKRAVDQRAELERIQKSLDLSLSNFQEMIQTYPLHTQYELMIFHSEKLREQFKVLRGIFDQLQYKLPNQSVGE